MGVAATLPELSEWTLAGGIVNNLIVWAKKLPP